MTKAELKKYFDEVAPQRDAWKRRNRYYYQELESLCRFFIPPDRTVLEIGCGTGGTAIGHAPFVRHIRAVDFSERMLEIARERASAAGIENVSFEQADITALSTPDEAYDIVLGLSILHLLKDPDMVIDRVFGMLKSGGRFVTSTACLGDTMKLFELIAPVGRALGLLPQLNVMTTEQLVAKFRNAGFEIAHQWQPGRGKAVFVVAQKPEATASAE